MATTPTSVVPQVYVDFVASPALVAGLTADTVACTGLASRGPVNAAKYASTLAEFASIYGPEAASLLDPAQPLSLWRGAYAMDSQGVANKLFNRVAGATLSSAYVHLVNAGGRMVALHAATPGTWANTLTYVVGPGTSASTFTLTITNPATGETDTLTALPWADNAALILAINQTAKLVVATRPVVDAPLTAPTGVGSLGSGTLPAGTYYAIMTYTNAQGETIGSPESVGGTLSGAGNIIWTAAALPTGAAGVKLYMGTAPGAETFAGLNAAGVAVTISALPAASVLTPPGRSTAVLSTAGDQSAIATPGSFAFTSTPGTGVGVGNNGESLATSVFIGAAGTPSTGLAVFAGLDPKPQEVFIAEPTVAADVTTWAAQAQLASDNNWIAVTALDKAMTQSAAVTALTTTPVTTLKASPNAGRIKVGYGGVNVQDSYYNQLLLYSTAGLYAAITAATDANTSAGYKPLANVDSALYDLSVAQAEQLIVAGANPVRAVRGVGLAFSRDVMLDGTEGFKVRLDMLLKDAFSLIGVGYLQVPNTPERRQALQDETMQYLDGLAAAGLIPANAPLAVAGTAAATTSGTSKKTGPAPSTVSTAAPTTRNYQAVCNDGNNTQGGQALPQLICDVQVTYFNNPVAVRFHLTTGTNVVVTIAPA